MKTKKASKTNTKTRIIFFAIALTYNLLLGLYLKDFLVLSPMFTTFYLLSALPTLFFVIRIRSNTMRAIMYITLIFVLGMCAVSFVCCRRFLAIMTMLEMVVMLMYLALSNNSGKDKLLTKICVLVLTAFIAVLLFFSYNFVYKPVEPYFSNGRDTLWDTQTEELADEICAGCETDEEKVRAFYNWIIANFEYDYDCNPLFQYFNVRKTLQTKQGICFDFAHLFVAFCRSQNIPCYAVDGTPYDRSKEPHTWNRVYFNGSWWDVDVTNDISAYQCGNTPYGIRMLEGSHTADENYIITKIY